MADRTGGKSGKYELAAEEKARLIEKVNHPGRKYKVQEDGYYLMWDGDYPGWQWNLGTGYFWTEDEDENGLPLPHNFILSGKSETVTGRINLAGSLFLGELITSSGKMDTSLLPHLSQCHKYAHRLGINSRMYTMWEYAQEASEIGLLFKIDSKTALPQSLPLRMPMTFLVSYPRVPLPVGRKDMELVAQWAAGVLGTNPVYEDSPSVYDPEWKFFADVADREKHWLVPVFQAYDKAVKTNGKRTSWLSWLSMLPEECAFTEVEAVVALAQANLIVQVSGSEIRPFWG